MQFSKINIFTLTILTLSAIYVVLHFIFRSRALVDTPFFISHRGAGELSTENTLLSIKEALKQGAKFIEIDIRRSADGMLLLMHDPTVNRVTNGVGVIKEMNWEELSRLEVKPRGSTSTATSIATLDSVLKLIKSTDAMLVMEVKDPTSYPGIEQELTKIILNFEVADQITVISFDDSWLKSFQNIAPGIMIGRLQLWPSTRTQVSSPKAISYFWTNVIFDPTLISRTHAKGCQVWVWTVNNPIIMRLLIALGVDGITTDRADLWRKV